MVLPASTVQPSLKACDSRQVSLASLDDSELDLHLLDALPILLHAVAQVDGAEHGSDHQACAQVTNPRYHGCVPTTRGEFASISLTPKQSIYPSIYRWLSPRFVDAPGELASPPPLPPPFTVYRSRNALPPSPSFVASSSSLPPFVVAAV